MSQIRYCKLGETLPGIVTYLSVETTDKEQSAIINKQLVNEGWKEVTVEQFEKYPNVVMEKRFGFPIKGK